MRTAEPITTRRRRRGTTRFRVCLPIVCAIGTALIAFTGGCDFPYVPQRQPDPFTTDTTSRSPAFSGSGTIYPVNIGQQSCNPSILPRIGCSTDEPLMLFLGYDRLSVNSTDDAYTAPRVVMHDRLTVVDTSNTVRWFFMRGSIAPGGDLQCPEWSTHCDYLTCLLGSVGKSYSGYAVRRTDHQPLKLCDALLEEFSTPFLYVADTVDIDAGGIVTDAAYTSSGFAERTTIERFFGTRAVKYVYTLPAATGTLYYVDYLTDDVPVSHPLAKPAGRERWHCASPMVSMDGNWVAYHCFSNATKGPFYSSYIQRLQPGSSPVLIADGASDPHWWREAATMKHWIIYTVTHGDYFTEYDFTDTTVERGSLAGCTLKQRLKGTTGDTPAHVAGTLEPDRSSPPDTLIRLPFKGGLSDDGYYLGTAYKNAYIAKLIGN